MINDLVCCEMFFYNHHSFATIQQIVDKYLNNTCLLVPTHFGNLCAFIEELMFFVTVVKMYAHTGNLQLRTSRKQTKLLPVEVQ